MKRVGTMVGIGLLGAVAALCGCAQAPDPYETAIAEIVTRHQEAMARARREADRERELESAQAGWRRAGDQLIAKLREPLGKFLAERPRSCSSRHLADAASGPSVLLARLQQRGTEIDATFKQRVGVAMLDIAEAAKHAGCPATARLIYDDALRTFVGSTHAELRLRAQFGVAYLVRNAARWPMEPTLAADAAAKTHATAGGSGK